MISWRRCSGLAWVDDPVVGRDVAGPVWEQSAFGKEQGLRVTKQTNFRQVLGPQRIDVGVTYSPV